MMTPVEVRPVVRSDAAELIRNNVVSRAYHEPWLRAFTDNEGFDAWFSGLVGGANIGLIAHEVDQPPSSDPGEILVQHDAKGRG